MPSSIWLCFHDFSSLPVIGQWAECSTHRPRTGDPSSTNQPRHSFLQESWVVPLVQSVPYRRWHQKTRIETGITKIPELLHLTSSLPSQPPGSALSHVPSMHCSAAPALSSQSQITSLWQTEHPMSPLKGWWFHPHRPLPSNQIANQRWTEWNRRQWVQWILSRNPTQAAPLTPHKQSCRKEKQAVKYKRTGLKSAMCKIHWLSQENKKTPLGHLVINMCLTAILLLKDILYHIFHFRLFLLCREILL